MRSKNNKNGNRSNKHKPLKRGQKRNPRKNKNNVSSNRCIEIYDSDESANSIIQCVEIDDSDDGKTKFGVVFCVLFFGVLFFVCLLCVYCFLCIVFCFPFFIDKKEFAMTLK